MRINLLTPGMTTPNGRAFLFPLLVWRQELLEAGIHVHFVGSIDSGLTDCDVLAIDSKFYAPRWQTDGDLVEAEIAKLADRVKKLLWFDTRDSTGWDQARAFPYVTGWIKNQLLCDRSRYLKPIYGNGRIFAEFARTTGGAKDEYPAWSKALGSSDLLKKLHVGWNSGLADYSMWGPIRTFAYKKLNWSSLLHFPNLSCSSHAFRPLDVSCRFGIQYARESVSWQRRKIAKLMFGRLSTQKLSRSAYFRELNRARVVVSPFGLGEITLKDFEVFLTGGALLKPDMSHMETWPNFFQADKTMAVHRWDMSDFTEVLDYLLANDERRMEISQEGQRLYEQHTVGRDAAELFIEHLKSILAID